MAQQFSAQVEVATSQHQYALKTKAGCETVAHILQVLTELDEEATVVSVDGIGGIRPHFKERDDVRAEVHG